MPDPAASAVRPLDAPLRLVRSVAAAVACVVTAAVGHLGAGRVLAPAAVVAVLGGATAIAWLLAARRVTPGQMIGLLVLCQVLVHLGAPTPDMHMGPAMVAAHVAATAVSAWLLARGEGLVWRLAESLGLRLRPVRLHAVAVPWRAPSVPVAASPSPHDVRLTHARVERGPPSGSR